MGIFGNKKQKTKKVAAKVASASTAPARTSDRDLSAVIIKPRITEKGVLASEKNVYVFEVRQKSTKRDIADAVKQAFGVAPIKVHTVTQSPRQSLSRARGRRVAVGGLKKAYVYLKEGDKINLV